MAVEPAVLEGALAVLLGSGAGNEVVEFHAGADLDPGSRYDAAIVTIAAMDGVHADVVITLPDTGSGDGIGHVTTPTVDRDVALRSHQQVIDLLDEQFPSTYEHAATLVTD